MHRQSSRQSAAAWISPVIVALVTVAAFLPALRGEFLFWDDDKNFLHNQHYRGFGSTHLGWMWTTFLLGHYIPLTWMSLGLDYLLWGMNPVGYHLTNVLLHATNAVLVYGVAYRILKRAGAKQPDMLPLSAAGAALLFAVHPQRVESVAWVTERRDVLSGTFFSLAVLWYLRACDETSHHRRWYCLSVSSAACALLSKAMAVTLPAVLLILNIYPLRRLGGPRGWWTAGGRRVIRELVPYAVLAAASAVITLVAVRPTEQLRFGAKLAVSAYSVAFSVWKTLVPMDLSPLYPRPPTIAPFALVYVASGAAVLAATALAWRCRDRYPGCLAAWSAFVVLIFPMLGVVQNGSQITADRFTYFAAPALAIAAGGALSRFRGRISMLAVLVPVVFTLSLLTWRQTGVWHDSRRLWSTVLSLQPQSSLAHNNLGVLLLQRGSIDDAVDQFHQGLAIAPNDADTLCNLGAALARQGRLADASTQYAKALALEPGHANAHNNLGAALLREGQFDRAIAHFDQALASEPDKDEAQTNRGVALSGMGDLDGAIAQYRHALVNNPDNADAHANWGNALVRQGKLDEAIMHYQQALAIQPGHADAHLNWGVALAYGGHFAEAIPHFREVLRLQPDNAAAQDYLERASHAQPTGS